MLVNSCRLFPVNKCNIAIHPKGSVKHLYFPLKFNSTYKISKYSLYNYQLHIHPLFSSPNTSKGTTASTIYPFLTHLNRYEHVGINLHEGDLQFINSFLDASEKDRRRYTLKRIRSQYKDYIPLFSALRESGLKPLLFGLNRKSELANFGTVAMRNKNEVFKLLYLFLIHGNNLLNNDAGLSDLKRLCPNIFDLILVRKSEYYYWKLVQMLKGLNGSGSVLLVMDNHLIPHFMPLLTTTTTSSSTEDMLRMESVNLKDWSLFLLLFLAVPSITLLTTLLYLLANYMYSVKKGQFVSVTLDDFEEAKGGKKGPIRVSKGLNFYNPKRD